MEVFILSLQVTEILNSICDKCHLKQATQRHHRFPQKKLHRKIYGKILDQPFNIIFVCADCHTSHAKIDRNDIWNEREFREEATFRDIDLPEGTKSYQHKFK